MCTKNENVGRKQYTRDYYFCYLFSVAFLHILASGFDQFVQNVLRQEGELNQVTR